MIIRNTLNKKTSFFKNYKVWMSTGAYKKFDLLYLNQNLLIEIEANL